MAAIHQAHTEKDAATIAQLAEEIWQEHYTSLLGKKQVAYMLDTIQSKEVIYEAIKNGTVYWIVEENEELAGYVGYYLEETSLFLSKFYLKKAQRGKGIGRQLFEELKKAAHENGKASITLTVNRENAKTIEAYRALGFHVLKEHVGDIGEGYVMDDYVMQYVLP